jgi:hypothetical protein
MAVVIPKVEWHYQPDQDANDGREWTEMDIDDLRHALAHSGTVESAARLLCRWGTKEDVRRKAKELDLIQKAARSPRSRLNARSQIALGSFSPVYATSTMYFGMLSVRGSSRSFSSSCTRACSYAAPKRFVSSGLKADLGSNR